MNRSANRSILVVLFFGLFGTNVYSQHDEIASLIEQAIQHGEFPGCVVCYGDQDQIVYLKAFGYRQLQPSLETMTVDTIFDLASLTKPIATATSVMILVDQQRLGLEMPVAKYLPEFGRHGKDQITIKHLLIHQSGLIPDNPLSDYDDGPESAWKNICELTLTAPIGTKFQYSDVNFIVLGELVKRVSDQSLDTFARKCIFEPLAMKETMFAPPEVLRARCAPTEKEGETWLRGIVHDPRARRLNGIAGHAGLFSSAHDLAKYASFLMASLRDGKQERKRESEEESGSKLSNSLPQESPHLHAQFTSTILDCKDWKTMTRAYPVLPGIRGLGWDKQTSYSVNRGNRLSSSAFGHGGFTGTVLWIDPEINFYFIFLSNRLHPDGKGSVNALSGKLIDLIVEKRVGNSSN